MVVNRPTVASVLTTSIRACCATILFSSDPIDDNVANLVTAQLLFLEAEDPEKTFLFISIPGWRGYGRMAIYDTMQFIRPTWQPSASTGRQHCRALARIRNTRKRYALPNAAF